MPKLSIQMRDIVKIFHNRINAMDTKLKQLFDHGGEAAVLL